MADMKELRERKKLKTVDVASRLGVGDSTVRGWESGRGTPSAIMFFPLMGLYGVSPEELDAAIRETLRKAGKLND